MKKRQNKLKAELLARYPLPCPEECAQAEPCEYHKHCGKWVGWDFCVKRDLKAILDEQNKLRKLKEEIEKGLWDDTEKTF